MVRKCDVPNCKEQKLSLFLVPKNAEERQKWCDILKCTFKEKAYVCEKHFCSSSIRSSFTSQTEHGVVLYSRQFQRKRLLKGALPSKLDGNDVPKKIKKLKNMGDVHEINLPSTSSPRTVLKKNDDQNCIDSSNILKTVDTDRECEKTDNNFSCEEQNNISEDLYLRLLESILSEQCDVKLPNKNWGIHKCIGSRSLIFTYCEMSPSPVQHDKLIPTCFKRVGFGPTLEIYFLHKDIEITSISKPKTVEELQDILLKVDSYHICSGGPSTNYYQNVYSECAIKVDSRWRHKKCSVILVKGTICRHCANLHSLLSRCADNQRKRKERMRWSATPSDKSNIRAIRKRSNVQQRKLCPRHRLLLRYLEKS